MVNDIMGGLFDLDYMSMHTVTEVAGDKQPMDKVLLESIISTYLLYICEHINIALEDPLIEPSTCDIRW